LAALRVRAEFFCRVCFLASTVARIRRSLAAPALLGSRVVVGVSGGGGSRVLVDAAAYVMHCGRRRRAWEDACAVHVDTSCVWALLRPGAADGGAAEAGAARDAALEGVLASALGAGLHAYVVPLEAAFADALCVVPVRARALARDGGGGARPPTAGGDPELPFVHPPPAAAAAMKLLADGVGDSEWTEGLMQQAKGPFEAQAAGLAI
jgi:hypothetical protein